MKPQKKAQKVNRSPRRAPILRKRDEPKKPGKRKLTFADPPEESSEKGTKMIMPISEFRRPGHRLSGSQTRARGVGKTGCSKWVGDWTSESSQSGWHVFLKSRAWPFAQLLVLASGGGAVRQGLRGVACNHDASSSVHTP